MSRACNASRRRDMGRLAGRVVLGSYLAVHGAQKLFGAFGGHGLDVDPNDVRQPGPPWRLATAA